MADNLKIDYEVLIIPQLFMRIKEDGKLTFYLSHGYCDYLSKLIWLITNLNQESELKDYELRQLKKILEENEFKKAYEEKYDKLYDTGAKLALIEAIPKLQILLFLMPIFLHTFLFLTANQIIQKKLFKQILQKIHLTKYLNLF